MLRLRIYQGSGNGKVDLMFTEIQSKQPPQVYSSGTAVSAYKSEHQAVQVIAKPQLAPIPKANIQVDTERAQQNLKEAISKLNDMLVKGGRGLNFSMDPSLEQPVVIVKNTETGEVIRQIPNEVIVQMAHNIDNFKGKLHNSAAWFKK